MGMDIYLEDRESRVRRHRACKRFERLVMLRDAEKDSKKRARLQKQVWKWYYTMNSARNGYFRVNYNDYSISY